MRYEMAQCDSCHRESCLAEDAPTMGWREKDGADLCPRCADEQALEAEHNLDTAVGYD